MGTVVVLPSK